MLGGAHNDTLREAPVNGDYDGRQYVGIDLHRRRSVIVRMTPEGEQLGWVRIDNDPVALGIGTGQGRPGPRSRARSDLRLVLGGRRVADRRRPGPPGAPAGGEGVRLPAGEERR